MLNKMQDKMFNMLAMCIVLYPCRIDESLEQSMKEKVTFDKLNRMQGKMTVDLDLWKSGRANGGFYVKNVIVLFLFNQAF